MPRVRLLAQVERGVRRPLTLVSAPAGSGKTVLVEDWAELGSSPGPVSWVTTEGDAVGTGLWTGLVAAFEKQGVAVDAIPGAGLDGRPSRATLVGLGASLAGLDPPCVVVLDDADYLADRAVAADVALLLNRCGAGLRLLILTRVDPALPLARYRLDGAMTEIRAADLALTLAEADDLMQEAGIDLTPGQLAGLHARTNGWAAGLRFFAMSLSGRDDVDLALEQFAGDEGDLAGYLMSEVLQAQRPDLRDALLRTSVVDTLTAELVETLTGCASGEPMLRDLSSRHSLLVTVPDRPGRFRYPPLLREFLRAELAHTMPDESRTLHRRAARWYAGHDDAELAVRHSCAGREWAEAARYALEGIGVAPLICGRMVVLQEMSAQPGDDDDTVELRVVRAAIRLSDGDVAGARVELALAGDPLLESADPAPARWADIGRYSVAAASAAIIGDVPEGIEAVSAAERSLAHLPMSRVRRQTAALLAWCRGRLALWNGDLGAARVALVEAVRHSSDESSSVLALSRSTLALVEAIDSDPADSWRTVLEEPDPKRSGPLEQAIHGLVQARLLTSRGDLAGAELELALARSQPVPQWLMERLARASLLPATLSASRPDGVQRVEGLLVEPLTPREREVLGLLADLLTTEEIAAEMFVSVNTVRTHVRNILRKLGVGRRNEAVRRAWELGLVATRDHAETRWSTST